MAPSAALVALGTSAFTFALAFGYFVSLASVSCVGRPEVTVGAPPVAVLVVVAFYVTVRILLITSSVNAADFLVYVTRVGIETFTARSSQFAVQLLVSVQG